MSGEHLTIKFPWKLRKKNSSNILSSDVLSTSTTTLSKTTRYIHQLKDNEPDRHREHLRSDAQRKKAEYISISLNEDKNAARRQKWANDKKRQRAAKRSIHEVDQEGSIHDEDQEGRPEVFKKRFKDLSNDEQKQYYRLKMRSTRLNRSTQKKTSDQRKDKERRKALPVAAQSGDPKCSSPLHTSTRTKNRRKQKVRQAMPVNPEEYADVVENLVSGAPATPRKVESMVKRGITNCRPEATLIAQNIRNNIACHNRSTTNSSRQALYAIVKGSIGTSTTLGASMLKRYLRISTKKWKKIQKQKQIICDVKKKKRKGVISDDVADAVRDFWWSPEVSRQLPLKKRVKKGVPLHLLECSYSAAYLRFKAQHPNIKIGYVKFLHLRPKNVRHMRASERIICCCIKCENVKLLLCGINQVLNVKLPADECSLSDMTLCPKKGDYAPKACIDRQCSTCGVDKISEFLQDAMTDEVTSQKMVQFSEWKTIEKTVTTKKKVTKKIKVVDRVISKVPLSTAVEQLKKKMDGLSSHLFRARWQQSQLKKTKANIQPKSAIMIMDYAENYVCSSQDEVQSAHWVNQAVTVHPIQVFINSSDEVGNITNKEALVFISDDLKHDADGVNHFRGIAYEHLSSTYSITHVEEYSDCCAQQYRCAKSFADLSMTTLTVRHNYFESSHGKSSADGLGATTKHSATMAVLRRQFTISNAEQFYNFCQSKLTSVGDSVFKSHVEKYKLSSRTFFYVCKEDVDRDRLDREVVTVKGTMKVHCVLGTGQPYHVKMRELTCTCANCQDDKTCLHDEYVGKWRVIHLDRKYPDNEISTPDHRTSSSPSVDDTQRPSSPSVDDMQRPSSPSVDDMQRPSSPSVDDMQRPNSPSVDDMQRPSSPSVDDMQRPSSPSVDDMQRPNSPSVDDMQRPSSPSVDDMQRPSSPSVDDMQRPNSPSVDNPPSMLCI